MKLSNFKILFLVFLPLTSSILYAADQKEQVMLQLTKLNESDSQSLFSGSNSRLSIDIAENKKTAKLQIEIDSISTQNWKAAVLVSAPYDSDEGESAPWSTNGVSNAASLGIKYTYQKIDELTFSDDRQRSKDLLCKSYGLSNGNCDQNDVEKYLKDKFEKSDGTGKLLLCQSVQVSPLKCNSDNFLNAGTMKYSLERRNIFASATTATIVPISVELGRSNFTYFSPTDFSERKDKETPYALSVGLGKLSSNLFYGLEYEYKRNYQPRSATQICRPFMDSEEIDKCQALILGAPTETKRENLSFNVNYKPFSANIAVSLKITHDFENNEQAIDIPVYFIETQELGLNGGLRFSWESEEKDIIATLFFGKRFSFF